MTGEDGARRARLKFNDTVKRVRGTSNSNFIMGTAAAVTSRMCEAASHGGRGTPHNSSTDLYNLLKIFFSTSLPLF